MKKPPKPALLLFLAWCSIHLLLGLSTLLEGRWMVDGDIWPFASTTLVEYYDIIEILLYCGMPLVIWMAYSWIIEKYYE